MEKNIQRDQARELFLQTELKQAEIAHLLNVNRKTVGLWIQQGKWREMKQTALQAPGFILQDLYNQLSSLHAAISGRDVGHQYPTLEESAIQRRLMLSIKSIECQSAGNYIQTYTELINELSQGDPALAREVCRYADDIIKRKYKQDTASQAQYMFLTDDVDELDNDQTGSSQITPPQVPHSDSPITHPNTNETSGDIQNSQIIQQQQPLQENFTPPTSQNNIPEKSDMAPEGKLPNGVTWLGKGMVFDPALKRERKIKMGEIDQFAKMGYRRYKH